MYIIKSSRLTRVIKYCKERYNVFVVINFLLSSSIIIPLILPPLFLLQMSHQIFFLAFSYTIVSTLSQLKKQQLHTDIFNVLFKNYFPRCYCIKLDNKDTIWKVIEKRIKQNLFISQCVLLPERWYSKTAKYWKTEFSLTSTGTSQSHDVKDCFLKHVYIYYIISWMNLANIRICIHCYAISTSFLLVYCLLSPAF